MIDRILIDFFYQKFVLISIFSLSYSSLYSVSSFLGRYCHFDPHVLLNHSSR